MKKDIFGEVSLSVDGDEPRIVRDAHRAPLWTRWLACRLLQREVRALAVLQGIAGIPEILCFDTHTLARSYIAGEPMQTGRPTDVAYFVAAAKLLRRLHRHGVVHNDLAKEPNWLITDSGQPAIVDFQLAWCPIRRGRLFRLLAREDLRHLLKHKRTYCPAALSRRERTILATPTLPSRIWMLSGKPLYHFVTRKLLRWEDREGASDRSSVRDT